MIQLGHGKDRAVGETSTHSAAALIGRSVADPHGISLGLITDVFADRAVASLLGFEVETPRERTFLPLGACSIGDETDEITVGSALSLLGAGEFGYYERRSVSLVHLRTRARGADFLLDGRGRIAAVMVQPHESPTLRVEVSNGLAPGRGASQSHPTDSTMALPFEQR